MKIGFCGSSLTRKIILFSTKTHSVYPHLIFLLFLFNTPLPLASSAAALRFASGIAQVDGCTRALSYNTQLSEMLRSAFTFIVKDRIYLQCQNILLDFVIDLLDFLRSSSVFILNLLRIIAHFLRYQASRARVLSKSEANSFH